MIIIIIIIIIISRIIGRIEEGCGKETKGNLLTEGITK